MKRIINKLIASNDYLLTFILLSIATGLAFLFFHSTPNASANISLLYILATILTARYTAGYRFGIFAALFSVVCINYPVSYTHLQYIRRTNQNRISQTVCHFFCFFCSKDC